MPIRIFLQRCPLAIAHIVATVQEDKIEYRLVETIRTTNWLDTGDLDILADAGNWHLVFPVIRLIHRCRSHINFFALLDYMYPDLGLAFALAFYGNLVIRGACWVDILMTIWVYTANVWADSGLGNIRAAGPPQGDLITRAGVNGRMLSFFRVA